MIVSNIQLGKNCEVDPSSSINNVILGDNVKVAKRCSIFGGVDNPLLIGDNTYIGMNTIIQGYARSIKIGQYVSIGQNVNIMSGSGPNNEIMKRIFPSHREPVEIGDLCWIGSSAIIMPGVVLGRACVVGANSYVTKSFDDYCVIGGTPAKLIRKLTEEEIEKIKEI